MGIDLKIYPHFGFTSGHNIKLNSRWKRYYICNMKKNNQKKSERQWLLDNLHPFLHDTTLKEVMSYKPKELFPTDKKFRKKYKALQKAMGNMKEHLDRVEGKKLFKENLAATSKHRPTQNIEDSALTPLVPRKGSPAYKDALAMTRLAWLAEYTAYASEHWYQIRRENSVIKGTRKLATKTAKSNGKKQTRGTGKNKAAKA